MVSSRALFLGAALLSSVMVACGETPTSAPFSVQHQRPTVTPTPVGVETPSGSGIYAGAYVSNAIGEIGALEVSVGRTLAMDMHYHTWVSDLVGSGEYDDLAYGRLPIESWQCGEPDVNVAGGYSDLLITTVAQEIKQFGHAVFVRFMWDANMPNTYLDRQSCWGSQSDNADGTFSATQYVAAWRHVRHIFAENNVTNVVWVWSFNAAGSDPTAYYPGNTEVDWVGIDAYDTGSVDLAATLSSAYASAAQFGKPVLISETGAVSSYQATFFNDAASELQSQFPDVKGFVYYDGTNGADWSLGTTGKPAFATFVQTPYLSAMGSV